MAFPLLLTVPARDGELEQIQVGPDGVQADAVIITSREASVGSGLAGSDQGAASEASFPLAEAGFPLAIVVVVLVLIVVGVAAGLLGFRSTRRTHDQVDDHHGQHLRAPGGTRS